MKRNNIDLTTTEKATKKNAISLTLYGIFIVLQACGYQSNTPIQEGTDSSTHWLRWCDCDADCDDLECLCGVCTKPCIEDEECLDTGLTGACRKSAGRDCNDTRAVDVCVLECTSDTECNENSPFLACIDGQCMPVAESADTSDPSDSAKQTPDASGPSDSGLVTDSQDRLPDTSNSLPDSADTLSDSSSSLPDARVVSDSGNTDARLPDSTTADPCAPMDANSSGDECGIFLGWTWNGSECSPVMCSCVGSECDLVFATAQQCQEAYANCSNGLYSYCNTTDDCSFDWETCCAPCDPDGLDDFTAIRDDSRALFIENRASACENIDCMPNPFSCTYFGNYPHIVSTCMIPPGNTAQDGVCSLLDLSDSEITACTNDSDCTIRPKQCCRCGEIPAEDLIAVGGPEAYFSRVCSKVDASCMLMCVATLPQEVTAYCDAGHCQLSYF